MVYLVHHLTGVMYGEFAATDGEIYDAIMQSQRVFRAYALAVNDGSIIPGTNMSGAALRMAVKAHM